MSFLLSTRQPASEIRALLDIGSAKVTCLVIDHGSRLDDDRRAGEPARRSFNVLGFGQRRADGVRAGMIVDLDRAEQSVLGAIGDAEEQAGLTVDDVVVALSSSRLSSTHFTAHLDLEAGHVRSEDLHRLAARARQYAERDGRSLVYLNRIHFALDGETGIRDPNHMSGRRLTCQYHAVTADPGPLQNLERLIDRCYLSVRHVVPTGLASAIAATSADERHYGVLCIDIGAGATKIAVIADGRFVHTDTLAVGGAILTHDIASSLGAPLAEAERIKTLYGSLEWPGYNGIAAPPQWRAHTDRFVNYRIQTGDNGETSQTELARLIYPRAKRQLELIRERIDRNSVTRELAQSIVLTGGASQLAGLVGLTADILGKPVRIGEPEQLDRVDPDYQGPALATVAGLGLIDASPAEMMYAGDVKNRAYESYLSRMGQWLRESF